MSLLNIAFVGPAGVGKTTLANGLVQGAGYRRHALADALKVGQAFMVQWQLGLIPFADIQTSVKVVERILRGQMGIWGAECGWEYFTSREVIQQPWLYATDVEFRDKMLEFVIEHKVEMRGLLQQYGTETIRAINAKISPETENTQQEPWLSIILNETKNDNRMGIPSCCDDVRYPHEAAALEQNGFLIVRVERDDYSRGIGITDENINHSSEQMHRLIKTDIEFRNEVPINDLPQILPHFVEDLNHLYLER